MKKKNNRKTKPFAFSIYKQNLFTQKNVTFTLNVYFIDLIFFLFYYRTLLYLISLPVKKTIPF